MKYIRQSNNARQQGAVLAISLIMLMMLAMIGTFGMQNTMLQERMSGNLRDKDLAFQAAETTLKHVQRALSNGVLTTFDGTNGLYPITTEVDLSDQNLTRNNDFWVDSYGHRTSNTGEDTESALGNGLENNPLYIVQQIGQIDSQDAYRITVRSTGKNPNSVVILQVVFTVG